MVIFGLIDNPSAPSAHRGAFVVFCTTTHRYSYSFPSSPNATNAAKGKAREIASQQMQNAYEAEGETLRRAIQHLQYMKNPTGASANFDCADWTSIAYEMDRAEKEVILANVGCDSEMSDAMRLR